MALGAKGLKEVLIWKINTSIWFRWMKKKTSSLTEDKRKDKAQKAYTDQNPKRYIPPVSLLLWRKILLRLGSRFTTVVSE